MKDLIADFIAETREMLEALGGEIVAWEAAPDDKARLDEIFRFVHTVKGNCGFFNLPRLEVLSHAAEGALAEVRSGERAPDDDLVSAVLAILDRIAELVQALETGQAISSADDEQLIAALSERRAGEREAQERAVEADSERSKAIRSIRLSVDLLDRMMNGISDMVLARNELARRLREAPGDLAVENAFERVSACIAEMRDSITRTRMQRMDSLFVLLPRMVRDISSQLGKKVALRVEGGDVELDREMIDMIRDPLTHIVRNAIDHGIESAERRIKAGKPTIGTLRISAQQSGNQILIEIADDGAGIDGDKLLRKAIAGGLLSSEQGERLSPAQRTALIFEAGLSTADEVTAISGRGVGMDVVRANIEHIGGLVDVESRPGHGLRLTLRVPLTLTIIPALTISVGGGKFAIPRSAIDEIIGAANAAVRIETLAGAELAAIRDRRIPLVSLADVLGVASACSPASRTIVVLRPAGGGDYALAVDAVHDHEELVVKPAAPAVMATGLYAGTTLADDGCPVLLLDAAGIAASAGVSLDHDPFERSPAAAEAEQKVRGIPALLFRTLDGAKRAVRMSVVERIEQVAPDAVKFSAGRLRIALGGKIVPLAGCGDIVPQRPLHILRLNDGSAELAYGFADMIDIVELADAIQPAHAPGEVGGVTLIDGEQIEVIDPHWLFGDVAGTEACSRSSSGAPGGLVCALADDGWMENILRPLIQGAGYRTVRIGDADAADADLVIITAEAEVPPAAPAADILKLRAGPAPSGPGDDSIYRYDRARLLSALGDRAAAKGKG
ncbi:MAG: chemotaxis protein CheA [Alphaproteobacteria bacterium]|nr:chemotaxis protein CheA [Alphaproteobacteria bacterium]